MIENFILWQKTILQQMGMMVWQCFKIQDGALAQNGDWAISICTVTKLKHSIHASNYILEKPGINV